MTMSGQEQVSRGERKAARRAPKPLDEARLKELALAYVARFATTAVKLERYLARKLRERGWEGERAPDVHAVAARMAELGYIDDAAWAGAKSNALLRKGLGAKRIAQTLNEAGVSEGIRRDLAPGRAARRRAALDFARRKRLGPFDAHDADPARREKQLAALLRAGHGFDLARAVLDAASEAALEQWVLEAEEEEGR
jgi:regulatory protein